MENQICTGYSSNIYCSSIIYFKQKVTYRARKLEKGEYEMWDNFVSKQALGNIHQTGKWGLFQSQKGNDKNNEWKFWIFAVFEQKIQRGDRLDDSHNEQKIVAGALVLERKMGLGKKWHYIAKGPVFADEIMAAGDSETAFVDKSVKLKRIWEILQLELDQNARQNGAVYIRVESDLVRQENSKQSFGDGLEWKGWRKAHAHYQPENTVMVDLTRDDEKILAEMKPKGRYNIKLAEKKGVSIKVFDAASGNLEWAVAQYSKILAETTDRDGFSGHDKKYYLDMIKTLGEKNCSLYLAEYQGEIIAGLIVTFYNQLAIYYFGASANKHRNVMAPYLLQWEAMREAKRRGMKWYDFLGVAPAIDQNGKVDNKHPWAGVTEFKLKFGGQRVDFLPAKEKIYKPFWYWLMLIRKKIRISL